MIEDLLKDIIATAKFADHNIRRGVDPASLRPSLNEIKEDGKIIYHLLTRVTLCDCQTTQLFDYETMLKKMGEDQSEKRESSNLNASESNGML
jgi:hypothetical protein